MYKVVINIALCVIGTFGFCILLNMPKGKIWIGVLGGVISSTIYETLDYFSTISTFYKTFIAVIAIEIYSEIMARLFKTPSTVVVIPSTIPLLPGGLLFNSINSYLNDDLTSFVFYFRETLAVAFALSLGSVIMLIILSTIRRFTKKE